MPKMGTTKNSHKINNNLNSNSTPEFNLLQNKLSKQNNADAQPMAQQPSETDQKISRKTA